MILSSTLDADNGPSGEAPAEDALVPETPLPSDPSLFSIYVAEILGAHGVGGNFRVRLNGPSTVALQALKNAAIILARQPDGTPLRVLTLRSVRPNTGPKGAWILRFREIKDRPDAESLYGVQLFVQEQERPTLPDGQYYIDEILGIEVITDAGRPLGVLTEVLDTPANDVYVTDKGALIPAVSEFVVSVDNVARRIIVRDVPGLLDTP